MGRQQNDDYLALHVSGRPAEALEPSRDIVNRVQRRHDLLRRKALRLETRKPAVLEVLIVTAGTVV